MTSNSHQTHEIESTETTLPEVIADTVRINPLMLLSQHACKASLETPSVDETEFFD